MNKKTGIVFVVFGAVLLLAALLFMLYNEYVDVRAGAASEAVLSELQEMIDERLRAREGYEKSAVDTSEVTEVTDQLQASDGNEHIIDDGEQTENDSPKPMKAGGYDCIGYLDMPTLELLLPVLSEWDYDRLNIAPCRHFGNVGNDDLVIAGHNYKRHFSYLSKLRAGDPVLFCDTEGAVHSYTVASIRNMDAAEVDAVKNSGHALVLYTCTFIGNIRTVVFCDRSVFF